MTTTDFSTPPQPQLDTGPLSWVMAEIRESLARSRTALVEAGGRAAEDQATQLQHAKSHLHQAHGALQMVDIDGVSRMTELAEAALDRFKAGTVKCSTDHVEAVSQLYQALIEYLEELLAGAPSQPARLFPYYRAVQEMIGAERIHPADLFFPDLSRMPGQAAGDGDGDATIDQADGEPVDYAAYRQRFERALLPYLKSTEAAQQREHAAALLDAVALVAAAQRDARARSFWLAMQGFAELVASGELAGCLYVKQLFGLINLQIRRLSQGTAALPEAMLRDALFFIAATPSPTLSPTARQMRAAFALDGLVPADYDTRRYGQIDDEALAGAKAAVARARAGWEKLAGADDDAALEQEFRSALADAATACDKLNVPAIAALARQLADVAQNAGAAGRSAELAVEMATALLFAGHGMERIRHLPTDFAANADTIAARLLALVAGETPPQPAQWQDGLARQMRQDDTATALSLEMKASLRQVEKVLDEYYIDPSKRAALADLDPVLHQLQGALAMLDQEAAMQAAQQVKAAVRSLAAGGEPAQEPKALDDIAQNVGALGFFVDMLAQNAAGARERFAFDAEQGSFRSVPFKKMAASDSIPVLDQEVAAPAPSSMPAAVTSPAASDAPVAGEPLDVFISEAREMLDFIDGALAKPGAEFGGEQNLIMLRRSFHNLKGSGRMVGLNQFADAAQANERVMNTWLAEERPVSEALFALLANAEREMRHWVDELGANGVSARQAHALVDAALRVQEGGEFVFEEEEEEAADAGGDNLQRIGELTIPLPLYDIYLAEADHLAGLLRRDFSAWRHAPRRPVSAEALQAAHTLAGTSGTVGFSVLREVALALESTLQALQPPAPHLDQAQHDLLDFSVERIRQMLEDFAQGRMPAAQPELIAALTKMCDDLAATPPGAGQEIESRLDDLMAETMESIVAPPPALEAEESPLDRLFRDVYEMISGSVPESEKPVAVPASKKAEARADDSIDDLFNSAFDDAFAEPPLDITAPPAVDEAPEPDAEIIELAPAVPDILAAVPPVFNDELDADLLPVFLEEGADLLPQVGEALRAWQHNPADTSHAQGLLRLLHTVKGSARMAGAMRLGQHAHEIETHIENMVNAGLATPQAFDELLAHYDHALLLFEQLQHPDALKATAADAGASGFAADVDGMDASASANATATATATATACADVAEQGAGVAPATPCADESPASARSPLVRVRADILDRLVNQAGEVSISRSKLENEVDTLRASLSDFSENLTRLRRQLREVEMQAESQIASRLSVSSDREFDPLEFDRFTRLQELTRMMAESVNDVASFHESLTRSVDSASDDLVLQARLTRELQRDLMRVRMVPFASIGERLFRVARQSAKEVDKRVNLDIRGGAVEIDRGVLERMAAPFEHLLRNAIAHGVESRAGRGAAGKNETGELLVQVTQQGNEVVIEFSDDGAGLDLPRIRAKALDTGLLLEGDDASDAQIADLIFEPGFSTAEALTELSGRGVGMDIVQSEAQALGGRVDMFSEPGKGTRFTIRLPLTLAVTQVVLLDAGGKTYAFPSILVEQVLQMKDAALDDAQHSGFVPIHGHQAALHYLPALLGDAEARPAAPRAATVMMLRNGNDRLAVQVDEVLGNREVVIKNIGPQLSRMAGIAGATVLGTGDIVLILNPVALAQHLAHQPEARQRYAQAASALSATPARPPACSIMVVDDSMTVRRVTQRLLEREGYNVLLAKDGVDALEQLHDVTPDLMLVDIEMPRMDGFDLTRQVRGGEGTKDIPIIMITSRSADKHRNYALQLGVNAYFGKPFQEPVLLEAIAGLLDHHASA